MHKKCCSEINDTALFPCLWFVISLVTATRVGNVFFGVLFTTLGQDPLLKLYPSRAKKPTLEPLNSGVVFHERSYKINFRFVKYVVYP